MTLSQDIKDDMRRIAEYERRKTAMIAIAETERARVKRGFCPDCGRQVNRTQDRCFCPFCGIVYMQNAPVYN